MKIAKYLLWAALIILVGMQFYRPEPNIAEAGHLDAFLADTRPDAEVATLLEGSCYDCHSANTEYPWYSKVAPVSYMIAQHVDEGKGHLDFSAWGSYDAKRRDHKLDEFIEYIENGEMPLPLYAFAHSEAKLDDAEKEALVAWAKGVRARYSGAPEQE